MTVSWMRSSLPARISVFCSLEKLDEGSEYEERRKERATGQNLHQETSKQLYAAANKKDQSEALQGQFGELDKGGGSFGHPDAKIQSF